MLLASNVQRATGHSPHSMPGRTIVDCTARAAPPRALARHGRCTTLRVGSSHAPFANPVYDAPFADPFVWRAPVDGHHAWCAIGTGSGAALADGERVFP